MSPVDHVADSAPAGRRGEQERHDDRRRRRRNDDRERPVLEANQPGANQAACTGYKRSYSSHTLSEGLPGRAPFDTSRRAGLRSRRCFGANSSGALSGLRNDERRLAEVLAMAGTGYGLLGILVIVLLVLLIVYFGRRV